MGYAAYLLALAVGYWVLTLAVKEKGKNQLVGKVIGWVIIVVAACGILCKAWCGLGCWGGKDGCGYGCGKDGKSSWSGRHHGMAAGKGGCHGWMGSSEDKTEEKGSKE